MKKFDYLPNTTNELIDAQRANRTVVAVASIALLAPITHSETAYAHEAMSPTTPPPTSSTVYRSPLPSNWPTSVTLGSKNCKWGAPIDRQEPLRLGSEVAAMVDTRCEPPKNQRFAYVRDTPDSRAQAIGRVYNGQFVRLDCDLEGRPVGDERNSSKNSQWFSITFRNRDASQQDSYGYINGANLGQIDTSNLDIPSCSIGSR